MDDLDRRWYPVPGHKTADAQVIDRAGELVCTCETMEIAERIADDHDFGNRRHSTARREPPRPVPPAGSGSLIEQGGTG